jgi:hypothetical protein
MSEDFQEVINAAIPTLSKKKQNKKNLIAQAVT